MTARFAALMAATLLAAGAGAGADQAEYRISDSGDYRLSYESRLEPIVINRIHSWVLHLETAAGEPVTGARFAVTGGMPVHDHGLPTEPRVTRELAPGSYLLEGVRFHMNGAWLMTISFTVDGTRDVVVVPLEL